MVLAYPMVDPGALAKTDGPGCLVVDRLQGRDSVMPRRARDRSLLR
jgi:hypothetical protein